MLSRAVWLDMALRANMQQGQRRRFPHDCGPGDVVLVSCDSKGLHAFCFRCSDDYLHKVERSTKEIIRSLQERQQAEQELSRQVQLPSDSTTNLPAEARLWLAKASLRQEEIRDYGIVYSPRLGRVCIPVYKQGSLYAVQARALGSLQPKYLQVGPRTCFASHQNSGSRIGERNFAVFTEDALSAIRVGRHAQSFALTGTSAPLSEFPNLAPYDSLVMWLDGDKAGVKGAAKLRRTLGLLHDDVRVLVTQQDPKRYADRTIREYLTGIINDISFKPSEGNGVLDTPIWYV